MNDEKVVDKELMNRATYSVLWDIVFNIKTLVKLTNGRYIYNEFDKTKLYTLEEINSISSNAEILRKIFESDIYSRENKITDNVKSLPKSPYHWLVGNYADKEMLRDKLLQIKMMINIFNHIMPCTTSVTSDIQNLILVTFENLENIGWFFEKLEDTLEKEIRGSDEICEDCEKVVADE